MSAEVYLASARKALEKLAETQRDSIAKAAALLVDAIATGQSVYAFGASHSFILVEEMVYRTGGLMLINPILPHGMNLMVRPLTLTSRIERVPGFGRELLRSVPVRPGDILILISTSGRNAVIVDMAMAATEQGMHLIGITSLAYTAAVKSRHASGKKLVDLCEVVLDNQAPPGDACVAIPGFPQHVGPLSTLTGVALVNALVAEVAARLMARGMEPPVFVSANMDGGDAWNERLLHAHRDRIHYLD